jgi:hypothetical protein
MLPALWLAFSPVEKNEAYDWFQHRLAGVGFATAFALLLLLGPWRQNRTTALVGGLSLAVMTVAGWHTGITDFHFLFILAGILVAAGHRWAQREAAPPLPETILVGLGAALSFWAVSRLSWWQPAPATLQSWPSRAWFIGVTAGLVWLLRILTGSRAVSRPGWFAHLIDGVVLVVLAAAVMRTNTIDGNWLFPHHWSVYIAAADVVREGGTLLGDTASQYGFLNTLILAVWPSADRFTALYWLNSILVWASGTIIYFTLKTWLIRPWWQLGAGLITVCCVAFLCGDAPALTGPLPCPSIAAVRFIWVYMLLGYLVWWHQRSATRPDSIRAALWIGSLLWLLGALWSVESAIYVTASWFPAATVMAMSPAVQSLGRLARLQALLVGIGRALARPGLLLAITLIGLTAYYRLGLGRWPVWSHYWEYAAAFSAGFGTLPIEPKGGVWVLLLLHTALIATLVGMEIDRRRASLALIWAGWGAFWVVSTYYISRSHGNNITNISPVLLLVVGVMVHAWSTGNRRDPSGIWIWLTVPAFVGGILWLVLTKADILREQWKSYAVVPQAARLLPPVPAGLGELIKMSQMIHPGRYSVLGQNTGSFEKAATDEHADWLPLRSVPLLIPLSPERRNFYLDAYVRGRAGGWLLMPDNVDRQDHSWLFAYIDARYTLQQTMEHAGWQAGYYLPLPDARRLEPLALAASGLPEKSYLGRNVLLMNAPAEVSWPLAGTERELVLEIGCDPVANEEQEGSGILFLVQLNTPGGGIFPIYHRMLDPRKNPTDRGLVRAHLILPPFPPDAKLTVRTLPGAEHKNAVDSGLLAGVSVLRDPNYSLAQFPGFSRTPDDLHAAVTYHAVEHGRRVLGLHAPASLAFRLHGNERSIAFDFAFRPGAYLYGGNTDGGVYRVVLRRAGQPDSVLFERFLRPLSLPPDQGNQHAAFPLPENLPAGAELLLTIEPAGNPAWDWTYLANLQVK